MMKFKRNNLYKVTSENFHVISLVSLITQKEILFTDIWIYFDRVDINTLYRTWSIGVNDNALGYEFELIGPKEKHPEYFL